MTKVSPEFDLLGGEAEHLAQRDKRENLVAQPQHGNAFEALDAMVAIRRRMDQLDDIDLRNGEPVGQALDDQGGNDRQGERDLDDEFGSLAGHAAQFDGAADLFDVGSDDVEADAAAGNVGDRFRGREARAEDVLLNLLLGHRGELGLGREAVRENLLANAVGGNAAAIIADLDHDVAADMMRMERDRAGVRLAGRGAVGRAFDAVVGAIADHMGERVFDHLEHLTIELGFGADHAQIEFLAEIAGQIAHEPRKLRPRIADRLHARLHHAFLQLGRDL